MKKINLLKKFMQANKSLQVSITFDNFDVTFYDIEGDNFHVSITNIDTGKEMEYVLNEKDILNFFKSKTL